MKTTKGNSILGSFAWTAAERFSSQGLGLLVQIILARLLLPEDFACLAIIHSLIHYLGMFVQAGLNVVVVQKENLEDKDVSTLLVASLIIALFIYLLLFFLAPIISDFYDVGDLVWPIRVMALVLFLYSYNSIQTGLLTRHMRFKTIFFRSVISLPIAATVGIVMAYLGFGVWALIAYSFLTTLITVIFMNLIPELRIKWDFSWPRAKSMYSFSGKILLSSLVSNGGDTIRTMTIGKVYSPSNLAYYDRAYNYANLATRVVKQSISSVMLPVLSRKQDDNDKILEIARKSVGFSAFIIIPVLTLLAVLSKPLILIVLTEKWLPSALFFTIFCFFRIPDILTSTDKQVYYALGRSDIGFYYEVILLGLNVLMLISTLHLGLVYIAVGALIVEYVANFSIFIISSKVYAYSLKHRLKDIIKPIFNSLLMFACIYPISMLINNAYILVLVQTIAAIVLYSFFAFITKDNNIQIVVEKFNQIIKK